MLRAKILREKGWILNYKHDKTMARVLAEFVKDTEYDCLGNEAVDKAKLCILDMVGAMVAAWPEQSSQLLYRWLQKQGGLAESGVMGAVKALPAANAAMLNSAMAHSLEIEDHHSHQRSLNHPGVCTIPAALAIAEREKKSGKAFITSVILGYEIGSRVSLAIDLGVLNLGRGFHESSVIGPFSACTAAGKLLSLPAAVLAQAYGICGSLAAGSMEFKTSEAWSKRLQVGNATRNGIMAAELAKEGFTGPPTIFEGKHGFYHAYAHEGNYELSRALDRLGEYWEIAYIQYKPFGCAGVLHSAVTAASELRKIPGWNLDQVQNISVFTSKKIVEEYARPHESKTKPRNSVGAQFSLQFSVAAMLVRGKALVREFSEEAISDMKILHTANLVKAIADPEIDAEWPKVDPTKIEIELKNGKVIRARVKEAKGDPANPVTDEEVVCKFRELTAPFLSSDRIEQIVAMCGDLQEVKNMSLFANLLKPEC